MTEQIPVVQDLRVSVYFEDKHINRQAINKVICGLAGRTAIMKELNLLIMAVCSEVVGCEFVKLEWKSRFLRIHKICKF